MALSQTITTQTGITVSNAYIRAENISLDDKISMRFIAKAYVQPDQSLPFDESVHYCLFSIDESNPYEQAYLYLKTLPQFADATDC